MSYTSQTLAAEVIDLLRQRGQTIACCESLSAGLLSACIADISGASDVLRGGLVTYATDVKHDLAGVDRRILQLYGPVSPECARSMAIGVRKACDADWGIALTGVAGPKEQDGHPVGEVWIAIAGPTDYRWVERMSPVRMRRRNAIREQAVTEALAHCIQALR